MAYSTLLLQRDYKGILLIADISDPPSSTGSTTATIRSVIRPIVTVTIKGRLHISAAIMVTKGRCRAPGISGSVRYGAARFRILGFRILGFVGFTLRGLGFWGLHVLGFGGQNMLRLWGFAA